VVFLAALVRGVTGFGGPLILVPMLGFFYPPLSSIAIAALVDLSCNVSLFRDALRQASLRTLACLVAGALLTIPIGGYVLLSVDVRLVARIVYSTVGVFAIVLLLGWQMRTPLSRRQFVGVGALAGVVLGATSFGATVLPFLYSGKEGAARSRATFILWALFAALVGLAVVLAGGKVGRTELWRALTLMPTYLIGTAIGNRFVHSIDDRALRRIVLFVLLATALVGLVFNWR
jgi:uncharacterized membrane protein YfcA